MCTWRLEKSDYNRWLILFSLIQCDRTVLFQRFRLFFNIQFWKAYFLLLRIKNWFVIVSLLKKRGYSRKHFQSKRLKFDDPLSLNIDQFWSFFSVKKWVSPSNGVQIGNHLLPARQLEPIKREKSSRVILICTGKKFIDTVLSLFFNWIVLFFLTTIGLTISLDKSKL